MPLKNLLILFFNPTGQTPLKPKDMIPDKLRKDFEEWCGFPLESNNVEDAVKEVRQRQYDLECEAHRRAKIFEKQLTNL
jgi:hypothetical protein